MKSASNGDVLNGSLQVHHVHVLLVAPLGAGHMAQPGTDQHEGGIAVRKTPHHASAAADLPVYSGRAKLTFKCREFAATPSRKR